MNGASHSHGRGLNPDVSRDHPHIKAIRVHQEDLFGAPVKASALPDCAENSDQFAANGGAGDQDGLGACVPFAVFRDILGMAVYGQTGQVTEYGWLAAYTQTLKMQQKLDGKPLGTKVTDDGSEPSTAILTLQTCGPNEESEWPSDPTTFGQTQGLVQAGQATPRIPVSVKAYSILTGTGPVVLAATMQGLLPYPDGKRGRGVIIEIASSYPDFDNATGDALLDSPPTGLSLDHGVSVLDFGTIIAVSGGVATVRVASDGTTVSLQCTTTTAVGEVVWLLANHWARTWSPKTIAASGPMPGCQWVSSNFMLAQLGMGASFYAINIEVGQ